MDNLSNNRNKKVTETHVVGALSLFKWFNWAHVVGSMYLFNWFNWDTCGGIYVFIQLIQQLSGVDWHMYRYCTIWWFSPHSCLQYCGSMTFWGGSRSGTGSADPCLWLKDPDSDPDPAIFVIDLPKMPTKNKFLNSFFAYYFLKVHVHHFQR
jgi:hypothetical protein